MIEIRKYTQIQYSKYSISMRQSHFNFLSVLIASFDQADIPRRPYSTQNGSNMALITVLYKPAVVFIRSNLEGSNHNMS